MFQLYIVIHAGAFKIYFAAVVMVLGVSLLTNQKLYRFLVKPRFEFVIFPQFRSRLSVCGALRRQPIVWTISRLGTLTIITCITTVDVVLCFMITCIFLYAKCCTSGELNFYPMEFRPVIS